MPQIDPERLRSLKAVKRLVVKIGTSLLTTPTGVNRTFLARLVRDAAAMRAQGREIILVTSGAIGTGVVAMGLAERPRTIPGKQAMAAIGQPRLMQAYAAAFARHHLAIAQVLLTAEDIHNRERYAHARNTLLEILRFGAIPVFNENDTVAVEEIKFGDNDTLSAHITNLAEADLLVILTDVDGLYSCHPAQAGARRLACVEKIDAAIEAMAGGADSGLGTGGMKTKLNAGKMVTGMGESMIIADGRVPRILTRLLAGEALGTIFLPQGDRIASRRRKLKNEN